MNDLTLEEIRQDLQHLSIGQRARRLGAWVARLNGESSGQVDPEVARELLQRLEALDEERKERAQVDPQWLRSQVSEWLETAGLVGGPEREQDPTRAPARGWHGWHLTAGDLAEKL